MYVSQTPLIHCISLYPGVHFLREETEFTEVIVSSPICFSIFYHLLCLTYGHLCLGFFDRLISGTVCELGKDTVHSVFFFLLISPYIVAAKHSPNQCH